MFLAYSNVDPVPIGLALKSVIMCMKLKSCVKLEVILKVCPKPHTSVLNTFAKCAVHYTRNQNGPKFEHGTMDAILGIGISAC